jgi:hypothetical protein
MITIPKSEYESLQKQVRDLQSELSLLNHGRDSNTSSTPPSQDMCRSNHNSLRGKSNRSTGRQIGHRRHHLSTVENPDEIISREPAICIHCGQNVFAALECLAKCRSIWVVTTSFKKQETKLFI